jgi:hypothetical protein
MKKTRSKKSGDTVPLKRRGSIENKVTYYIPGARLSFTRVNYMKILLYSICMLNLYNSYKKIILSHAFFVNAQ